MSAWLPRGKLGWIETDRKNIHRPAARFLLCVVHFILALNAAATVERRVPNGLAGQPARDKAGSMAQAHVDRAKQVVEQATSRPGQEHRR